VKDAASWLEIETFMQKSKPVIEKYQAQGSRHAISAVVWPKFQLTYTSMKIDRFVRKYMRCK